MPCSMLCKRGVMICADECLVVTASGSRAGNASGITAHNVTTPREATR